MANIEASLSNCCYFKQLKGDLLRSRKENCVFLHITKNGEMRYIKLCTALKLLRGDRDNYDPIIMDVVQMVIARTEDILNISVFANREYVPVDVSLAYMRSMKRCREMDGSRYFSRKKLLTKSGLSEFQEFYRRYSEMYVSIHYYYVSDGCYFDGTYDGSKETDYLSKCFGGDLERELSYLTTRKEL